MHWKRRPDQRGAALLEFALVFPVFMLLVIGMLEFGLVFKDYLTVSNSTRAGARVASAAGHDGTADYDILKSVKAAIGAVPTSAITRIVVFDSDASGAMDPTCKTSAVANKCNVYTAADLDVTLANFNAVTFTKKNSWPAANRDDHQATADFIGVWIRVDHSMVTKMFGSNFTLTDTTVMRIEPRRT